MMQANCPCCNRTITAYDQQSTLKNLNRESINTALRSKFLDCYGSVDSKHPNTRINESFNWEEDFHPDTEIDSQNFTLKCLCGAEFEMIKGIHLTNIVIPTLSNKHWIDYEVKNELDITEHHVPASTSWHNTPVNTGYHGASVPGCSHNYMFQRDTYNGTIVKCFKCGHEKTI